MAQNPAREADTPGEGRSPHLTPSHPRKRRGGRAGPRARCRTQSDSIRTLQDCNVDLFPRRLAFPSRTVSLREQQVSNGLRLLLDVVTAPQSLPHASLRPARARGSTFGVSDHLGQLTPPPPRRLAVSRCPLGGRVRRSRSGRGIGLRVGVRSPFPKLEGLLPVAKDVQGAVPPRLLQIRAWRLSPRGLGGDRRRAEGLGIDLRSLGEGEIEGSHARTRTQLQRG